MKSLTEKQRRLIELCRRHAFCRICELHFSNGEPSFKRPPIVESVIRLGGKGKSHKPPDKAKLSEEEQELLDLIREHGEGVIQEIKVRDNQPRDVKFQDIAVS